METHASILPLGNESPRFSVQVFGPFFLDRAGEPYPVEPRVASLIAFLTLHPKGASRAAIADAFWPESPPEAARTALRTTLRRARLALGSEAFVVEEDRLRLNEAVIAYDSAAAIHARRKRKLASTFTEAIEATQKEWATVQHQLLPGWEEDWVVTLREDWRQEAFDCGCLLARMQEEAGEVERALEVLERLLVESPCHAEALEHAMRLTHRRHGRVKALALFDEARRHLGAQGVGKLPESIVRLSRTIREDGCAYLPPPAFADPHEVVLIGHLFEANLRHGGGEALAMLARESYSPVCMRHPAKTLDLLRKAIDLTEGLSEERTQVICAAVQFAIFLGDHPALHRLTDLLIDGFPPEHVLHNGSLLVKGNAYMEAREFTLARRYLDLSVEGCTTPVRRAVALAARAGVDWQEGRYDVAAMQLQETLTVLQNSDREDRHRNQAAMLHSLCAIHLDQGEFSRAIEYGERAITLGKSAAAPVATMAHAPYGLALVLQGQLSDGLRSLRVGLVESHREGLARPNAVALDMAGIALRHMHRPELAAAVLDAGSAQRRRLSYARSPAERRLLERHALLDAIEAKRPRNNPLRLQSPGPLAEWVSESLTDAEKITRKRRSVSRAVDP